MSYGLAKNAGTISGSQVPFQLRILRKEVKRGDDGHGSGQEQDRDQDHEQEIAQGEAEPRESVRHQDAGKQHADGRGKGVHDGIQKDSRDN